MNRREKNRIRMAEWRAKNPERNRANQSKWYKENATAMRLHRLKWYYKNKLSSALSHRRWRLANLDKTKKDFKTWYESNLDKIYDTIGRRRARLLSVSETNCEEAIHSLQQAKHCHWCGCSLGRHNLHIDHVIPLFRGGTHTPDNLVAACKFCNTSKGRKTPDEWIEWRKHVAADQ